MRCAPRGLQMASLPRIEVRSLPARSWIVGSYSIAIAAAPLFYPLHGSQSLMNRCEHSVYLPAWAKDGKSPYCSCCNSTGLIPDEKANLELPRSSSDPLTTSDRVMANGHNSGCPECGSAVYLRVKESGSDANRECAECGKRYRRKLTVHQQAQELLRELEETE